MGHEYCREVEEVEEVGSAVCNVRHGQFVIGSFFTSDNTCASCNHDYQNSCVNVEFVGGAQPLLLRLPQADGRLVATSLMPTPDMLPDILALSEVMGTGWFGAAAAQVWPGASVAVVGDGAV